MNVSCARCDGGDPDCTACGWKNLTGNNGVDMSRKNKHTKSRRRRKIGSKKRRARKNAKK